jgi:hypothetical protein
VGDNAHRRGDESGETGNDDLAGAGGADFMVGDNYGTGRGGARTQTGTSAPVPGPTS